MLRSWECYRRSDDWPCVTDFVIYTTCGLKGLRQGDEHHAYGPMVCGTFTFSYSYLPSSDVELRLLICLHIVVYIVDVKQNIY